MKNSLKAIGTAARELLRKWPAFLLFNLLYALFLGSVYLFFATREARVWQLIFTAILALAAPVLFYLIQAAAINYAVAPTTGKLLLRTLRDFLLLLLISLPFIAIGVGLYYLLNKLQMRFPVPVHEVTRETARAASSSTPRLPATPPPMPLHWPSVFISTLRIVLLFVVLPLLTIQFWIAFMHEGFVNTLKRLHRIIGRAFAGEAIMIYMVGLLFFGLFPYFLIFTRTPIKNGWGELLIFGIRLLLAFALTLWGWVITIGALTRSALDTDTRIAAAPTENYARGNLESTPARL